MLWLCIHLHQLSLDLFQRGDADEEPFAVVEGATVLAVNAPAAVGGLRAGMRLTAAQALVPRLRRRERDRQAEARALERLAAWSLQFTPRVSLQPPGSLLLEIGGSLRYFGGLAALRRRLGEGLRGLGYHHVLAVAPTPTAALLLARAGRERPVTGEDRLRPVLAGLPLDVLDLDKKQHKALASLGLRTLGDCLALPRDGLARRLGPELTRQLDRATGQSAEPRSYWQPPPRFRSELELPAEVEEAGPLLFGFQRLVRELCGYLEGIESGVQRLEFRLFHRDRAPTPFQVGLVAPSREPDHLLELTRQRLERLALTEPVMAVALASQHIEHRAPRHYSLLPEAPEVDISGGSALLERLSARLGEPAVQGLRPCEDHRPERAWRFVPPGEGRGCPVAAERPLWLLEPPRRLAARDSQPAWHGLLALGPGPERIESGWWDGADIARDYYIATTPAGERLWIFRDRRGEHGWYLHGIFA